MVQPFRLRVITVSAGLRQSDRILSDCVCVCVCVCMCVRRVCVCVCVCV